MPNILLFARLAAVLETDVNYFVGVQSEAAPVAAQIAEATEAVAGAEPRQGWDMSGGSWKDAYFSGLSGLADRFSVSNIDKCLFVSSELEGLMLRGNNINGCDFSRSDLRNCNFRASNLNHSNFAECDLTGSVFDKSNVADCDLSGANLTDVHTKCSNLKKLKLTGATLCRTVFSGQLTEITFSGTLTECAFDGCDFTKVVFDNVTLVNCFFKNAKLNKTSKLKQTKFVACKADCLTYAFLKNCKADLSDVTLIEVN
jgi:uncharacterized protein YjbI with pentapeptide repeats